MTAKDELKVRAQLRAAVLDTVLAVETVLHDLEEQLQPYVADESVGGDTKLQFAAKLAGVWLVRERLDQLRTHDAAREADLVKLVQKER